MSWATTPKKTLRFARDALAELEAMSADFFTEKLRPPNVAPTKNYSVVEYREPESGDFIYKFKITRPFPLKMERLAAEAIQGGKNAFDQAIYSATAAIGELPRKGKGNLHMPWSRDPIDMAKRVEAKGIIPVKLRPVIYAQEPYFTGNTYAGGNDEIRQLAQLANAKHTIGFTVNTTARFIKYPKIGGAGVHRVEIVPPGRWNSMKNEVFIARTPAKARIYDDYIIDFQIAFDEAPPLRDIPAIAILNVFLDKAQTLLEEFEAIVRS